ncbi:unnamed protein product [Pocillopora meandrina]|uniref:Uncharacterized protein n=1 Tax=Pocillopora meandrina TaxID=46732 RepID=A0AAU9VTY4_9CNID|nr:unnamed protein product [Pocillopora meandrina]
MNGKNSSVIHFQALVMLKYIQLILYLKLLGSFRSRFVSEYDRNFELGILSMHFYINILLKYLSLPVIG